MNWRRASWRRAPDRPADRRSPGRRSPRAPSSPRPAPAAPGRAKRRPARCSSTKRMARDDANLLEVGEHRGDEQHHGQQQQRASVTLANRGVDHSQLRIARPGPGQSAASSVAADKQPRKYRSHEIREPVTETNCFGRGHGMRFGFADAGSRAACCEATQPPRLVGDDSIA